MWVRIAHSIHFYVMQMNEIGIAGESGGGGGGGCSGIQTIPPHKN